VFPRMGPFSRFPPCNPFFISPPVVDVSRRLVLLFSGPCPSFSVLHFLRLPPSMSYQNGRLPDPFMYFLACRSHKWSLPQKLFPPNPRSSFSSFPHRVVLLIVPPLPCERPAPPPPYPGAKTFPTIGLLPSPSIREPLSFFISPTRNFVFWRLVPLHLKKRTC